MKTRKSSLDLGGWSPRGKAALRRKFDAEERRDIELMLPGRVSILEMGQATTSAANSDGTTTRMTFDEFVKEALISHALAGDYVSAVELYRLLDQEEDAGLAKPCRPPTRRQEKQLLEALKGLLRILIGQRNELIERGLAVLVDGRLEVAPGVSVRALALASVD